MKPYAYISFDNTVVISLRQMVKWQVNGELKGNLKVHFNVVFFTSSLLYSYK